MGIKLTPKTIACLTLLVYWGPSNALGYLWGFILLLLVIFIKKDWPRVSGFNSLHILGYSCLFLLLFLLSAVVNHYINPSSINNFFWSFLTYGSVFSALVAFMILPFGESDAKGIFKFQLYLSLIQVVVGYAQMLYGTSFHFINPFNAGKDAGDLFVGTTFNPGIGSLVAIKLSLAALLLVPFWFQNKNWKNSLILFLLFVGWVLASALFTLIIGIAVLAYFFVIRKVLISLFTFKLSNSIFYITIIGVLAITIFVYTQSNNIQYVLTSLRYGYATLTGVHTQGQVSTRKVFYYQNTIAHLPFDHPSMLWVGVGPGNYSSRSAWMVSGEYLEKQPSYIPITPSKIAQDYVISLWSKNLISDKFKGAGSITHQPFSTWLSVFAEMGIPGLITLIIIFSLFYKSFKRASLSPDPFVRNMALGLKISLVYLVFLFFMENLFEYPIVMGQFFIFACAMTRSHHWKGNQSSKIKIDTVEN